MAEGADSEVLSSETYIPDFDDEVKLAYGKYGVEGLLEKIDAWKQCPVKIAVTNTFLHCCHIHVVIFMLSYSCCHLHPSVKSNQDKQVTGSSGCGKSSFINRVRGLTPDDAFFENESGEEVTFQVTDPDIFFHQARRCPTPCMLLLG